MYADPGIHISGAGQTVFAFHSSLSSSRQWGVLKKLITQEYRLVNVDLLGYGTAEKLIDSDYSFAVELARLDEIIRSLNGEKFHLVGHSCGGALALKVAMTYPQQVASIALYEPVAFHLLEEGTDARAECDLFASKVAVSDAADAARAFTDFWNKVGFFDNLPAKLQLLMAKDMDKVNMDFKALTGEEYTAESLKVLHSPTLIMYGKHSPKLSKTIVDTLLTNISNVQSLSFDAGHMGPIDEAQTIQFAIADFIKAQKKAQA